MAPSPISLWVRRWGSRVSCASRLRPRRSCTGTTVRCLPPYGAWWTDASLFGRSEGVRWLASSSHRRDSELSACRAAAGLSSVRISRWAQRSSSVTGPGSPRSKATAAAMFWLARAKCGRASSSAMILRFMSWAMAHARLPSQSRSISQSSSTHSYSSWSHASSSSRCQAFSYSSHWWGRAPVSPLTSSSRSFNGVASSSWMLSTCPSRVPAMKHSREG